MEATCYLPHNNTLPGYWVPVVRGTVTCTNIFSIFSNNGKCKSRTGQWTCLLFGLLMKGTVRSPTTCFVFCAIIFDVILCQSFTSVKMSFRAEDVVFYLVGRNKQGESNAKKYLSKQKRIGRTHVKKIEQVVNKT